MQTAKDIFSYRPYWASKFDTAPFLPMHRSEMDLLGRNSCDVILVTGDAYVDHPSFVTIYAGRGRRRPLNDEKREISLSSFFKQNYGTKSCPKSSFPSFY